MTRQLGLDSARVAGTGPDGATTLADVLREAGRRPHLATRPPPPRTILPTDSDAEAGQGACRLEIACDAKAVREACRALAAVAAEPPEAVEVVVRLVGAALRDSPGLALVIRTPDAPDAVLPPDSAGGEGRPAGVVLAVAVQAESIRLGLELETGSGEEGAAFLDRLRSLCLDPRRALL